MKVTIIDDELDRVPRDTSRNIQLITSYYYY